MAESINVLYVDTDPAFKDRVASFFSSTSNDIQIHHVSTVSEALDSLSMDRFDCLVTDYQLSDMHGIDLLEEIRSEWPNFPVILFTDQGNEQIASQAITSGISDYLRKEATSDQFTVLKHRIENLVQQHRAIKQQKRQLDAIESAHEGISILDSDGNFEFVNSAYANPYGYTPDELIGQHWHMLYREEDVETVESEILPEVAENGSWLGETIGLRKDGSTFVADHSLAQTVDDGLVCTIRDISKNQARRQELQIFKEFVEQSPMLVTLLDKDGTVVYDNTGLDLEWRHGPENFLGDNVFDYIHPADQEEVFETFELVQETPNEPSVVEYRFLGTDNEWRWLRSIAINRLDDPMIEGIPVTSIDITDRKSHEEELKRQNERLEEFVGVVSHDLRNPLNVATGHLSLVAEECDSDSLDAIDRALTRMNQLISELLTLARSGETVSDPEHISLTTIAHRAWNTVETLDANINVETQTKVSADPNRIQQLFENLFRNAVEHGGNDVSVTVGDMHNQNGFFVEDTGPGIPLDEREKVFESGYTTVESGAGFGLSIVDQIVQAHGWNIEITESDIGGARFEITGIRSENPGEVLE